jgi:hypothetical protein
VEALTKQNGVRLLIGKFKKSFKKKLDLPYLSFIRNRKRTYFFWLEQQSHPNYDQGSMSTPATPPTQIWLDPSLIPTNYMVGTIRPEKYISLPGSKIQK